MNVGFDFSFANYSFVHSSGIGKYSSQLFATLEKADENQIFFPFIPLLTGNIQEKRKQLEEQLKTFIDRHSIDIFHITSLFIGAWLGFGTIEREWLGEIKVVATLYDFIPLLFKEVYLRNTVVSDLYYQGIEVIRSYDHFVAISNVTRQDAITHAKIDPKSITVISGGVDNRFLQSIDCEGINYFGINKPYILCTAGNGDFRKNIGKLIVAFSNLPNDIRSEYRLVIVGQINPEWTKLKKIDKQLDKNVILTGRVSDEDLIKIYRSAHLFVFPSLYEGFGLPVLEAMACGIPVITSNTSSLSEVCGNAAYKIDPNNVIEITNAMTIMIRSNDLRMEYRHRGLTNIKSFNWDTVGSLMIDVYRHLYEEKEAVEKIDYM